MSEFDSSGKEIFVGSDISLPPKAIANEYIKGTVHYLSNLKYYFHVLF
jgi:hypothetical protein